MKDHSQGYHSQVHGLHERAGRLKATSNFFERKIINLVVIGRFRQQ